MPMGLGLGLDLRVSAGPCLRSVCGGQVMPKVQMEKVLARRDALVARAAGQILWIL